MNAIQLRPRVADLVFHVYDRPLHPELFEIVAERRVEKHDFALTVRITRAGHVITWETTQHHLTEVAAAANAELPGYRALVVRKMYGSQCEAVARGHNLSYQATFQVEVLSDEIYAHVHEEIVRDGLKRGLLHNHRPKHRLALAPLGFVTTEAWEGNLVLNTFHTFPDERTIVKSQTLIERRL